MTGQLGPRAIPAQLKVTAIRQAMQGQASLGQHGACPRKRCTARSWARRPGGGDCAEKLQAILDEELGRAPTKPAAPVAAPPLSKIDRMKHVTKVLDEEIRPALKKDGGYLELVDIDGTTALVALPGTCQGCPVSNVTLTEFVQHRLREFVEVDSTVREAGK